MNSIDELNRRFAIEGVAQITAGNGGLPRLNISTPKATAEIYLHGAQLTSWRPAGAEDVIFLSQHSQFEAGRAIRGGIPVCFPWFRNKADDPKARRIQLTNATFPE
jgi:glucose-6-phosphate 1-epimerase